MNKQELIEKLEEYDLDYVVYLLKEGDGLDAINLADEIIDLLNKVASVVQL